MLNAMLANNLDMLKKCLADTSKQNHALVVQVTKDSVLSAVEEKTLFMAIAFENDSVVIQS